MASISIKKSEGLDEQRKTQALVIYYTLTWAYGKQEKVKLENFLGSYGKVYWGMGEEFALDLSRYSGFCYSKTIEKHLNYVLGTLAWQQ